MGGLLHGAFRGPVFSQYAPRPRPARRTWPAFFISASTFLMSWALAAGICVLRSEQALKTFPHDQRTKNPMVASVDVLTTDFGSREEVAFHDTLCVCSPSG